MAGSDMTREQQKIKTSSSEVNEQSEVERVEVKRRLGRDRGQSRCGTTLDRKKSGRR